MLGEVPDKVGHEMTVGACGIVTVTDTYSANCLLSKKSIRSKKAKPFCQALRYVIHADAAFNGSSASIKLKLTGAYAMTASPGSLITPTSCIRNAIDGCRSMSFGKDLGPIFMPG